MRKNDSSTGSRTDELLVVAVALPAEPLHKTDARSGLLDALRLEGGCTISSLPSIENGVVYSLSDTWDTGDIGGLSSTKRMMNDSAPAYMIATGTLSGTNSTSDISSNSNNTYSIGF